MSAPRTMVAILVGALVAAVALPLLRGMPARTWSSGGLSGLALRPAAHAGRPLTVRLTSTVRSASARIGDPWTGIVIRPLVVGRGVIHAGTPVNGVVTDVRGAGPGTSAMLELAVQALTIGGRSRPLATEAQAFVAGTPRPLLDGIVGRAAGEVVLKPRTVMVFSLDERIAMR
ncbi:MAG: hypothetical protein ACRENJ_10165 [Candidatus Eiseniibacteriota bacterium]